VKVALDTNILAYAEGVNDVEKRDVVLDLVRTLPQEAAIIPVQVLGELFNVLTRKAGRSRASAREALLSWRDTYPVVATSPETLLAAADLATDHAFSIWDAVTLAVASQAGCRILISEDLQDGFTWGGVTVVNPFVSPRHALLKLLLSPGATQE
jgi:predicted nucleic acid-binding protein